MATILVIDDDKSLLSMIELMLKRAGHQTLKASDGQQGIEIARREQPDMAIVDLMMPELSGYEVCRILREDQGTADIPLLILTALSQEAERREARRSGADNYVTKPIMRDDLIMHVEELLTSGAWNMPEPLEEEAEMPPPEPDVQEREEPASVPGYEAPEPPAGLLPMTAVMGLSGGVGATTIAINLAMGMMQFGRSCIFDAHGQTGQVAAQLQINQPRATWRDLLNITPGDDKRRIGQALTLHQSGVAVIPAPVDAAQSYIGTEPFLYIYDVLAEGFRRIVADIPTQLNPMGITTLRNARHIVTVVGDNPASLNAAATNLANIEALGIDGTIHLVLNRTRPHGVAHEDVQKAFNYPIAADIPYEPDQVQAQMKGQPLLMSQPDSLFSRAIIYLSRQL